MDIRFDDTKPYAVACDRCGASPTQPGRTQVHTALVSAGELVEWVSTAETIASMVEGLLEDAPLDLRVQLEQLHDTAAEMAQRLTARRHELELKR